MSDFAHEKFPTWVLGVAGGVVGITILVVFSVRLGVLPGRPTAPEQRIEKHVGIVAQRDFVFADRADGALIANDAKTGRPALILEPGSNSGFIRGVMRGMMRERMLHDVSRYGAVTITQWADGALTLKDPSTGRILELGSFGHTNRAAFAQLLAPGVHVVESIQKMQPNGPRTPDDNSSVGNTLPDVPVATSAPVSAADPA
ncbi:photosynthetic complex assembly protein PuhC [Polymorphobacter fuscus]|uniref:Phosphonoacetaldehyde methylase n=1 Tax=Sandarakinorhabdus fusca TaxID=1439888 RepID=A0A7C9GWC5_9SPHN|nr:photosynthetic complex assembly protein PuhC [Polymorphobacter fuscus]KAB7644859.1 phosphonoacetaldehyde methylase [Polymorphobacter fuscus]MQT18138.1 phosphonoacetaldehyde methylase [Polymorphobacter fuscus]NJC09456.1 putative photosynthetic complex assembly protein [Polymorphobacter fuscus]